VSASLIDQRFASQQEALKLRIDTNVNYRDSGNLTVLLQVRDMEVYKGHVEGMFDGAQTKHL